MFRWNTWNKNETNEIGLTFYTLILIISNIKLVKRYNKQCENSKKECEIRWKRRWWYGATIRDVAKRAGVSPATVSRYFHGKNVVTTETSKRIEKAVRELSYKPVYKQKNPGVIAVLIPNLKLAYFSEVLKNFLDAVPKYGCRMIFIPVVGQDESYKQYFKELDITGVIYLEENTNQDMHILEVHMLRF